MRTVLIPPWAKKAIDEWLQVMPYSKGLLLGKANKGGRFVGQGMTAPAIYGVALKYEKLLQGYPENARSATDFGKYIQGFAIWHPTAWFASGRGSSTIQESQGVCKSLSPSTCLATIIRSPQHPSDLMWSFRVAKTCDAENFIPGQGD